MECVCVEGKLFVGGLKRETSEETLEQHFSKYGQVKDCIIMKKWIGGVGRSRGFGFVTFLQPFHAHQALHDCRNPIIDGKMVEVKPAIPRNAYTRDNFYNTGFELGFGTMNGFGSSSGTYLPSVYHPYTGGFCYYYCPFMVPLVASCFCGANMYTGWNGTDHASYYTTGFHLNDGGVDRYHGSEERAGHVNYLTPRGAFRNDGVNDFVGNEVLADHANYSTSRRAKRADHANCSSPRGADDCVGNKERADHANCSTPKGANDSVGNKERAGHANFSTLRGANDPEGHKKQADDANFSTLRGANDPEGNKKQADNANFSTLRGANDPEGKKKQADNANFSTLRGGNGSVGNKKRADHANFSTRRGANCSIGNKEGAYHANFPTPRGGANDSVGSKEQANHGDPGPNDSAGDVPSRSNGKDDHPTKIIMRVHTSNAEALITNNDGLDNHDGAINKFQVILQKEYSG